MLVKPGARMIAPTLMVLRCSVSLKSMACVGQTFSQAPPIRRCRRRQLSASMTYLSGTDWSNMRYAAGRMSRPRLKSLATTLGQTSEHLLQATHFCISIYFGACLTVTVRSPISPVTSTTSALVNNSMFRRRPHSTSLGDSKHSEQSLVGKILSSWAMMPPIPGFFSTR